jgi:hypothetical protein
VFYSHLEIVSDFQITLELDMEKSIGKPCRKH